MKLSNQQLETLTWLLIYSGLLLLCLGLFVRRGGSEALGWTLLVAGLADTATGLVLLWWRSRRAD